MGMLDSFFSPGKAYKKAGKQLEKYYNQGQGYLQPYNQQGQQQFQRLMDQAGALNDPAALQAKWASGYEMSPQAKQLQQKATTSGLDAASSMGLMGSSSALNNIQNSAGEIMQGDRQNYMNDLMQKYLASIGIGQNLYGTGANAAGAMSQNAMNQGQNMAAVKYGQQSAPGEMFGKLLGMGMNGIMNFQTGGSGGAGGGGGGGGGMDIAKMLAMAAA